MKTDTDFTTGHDVGGEVQSRMDETGKNTEVGRRDFFRLACGFAGAMLTIKAATGMKFFKVVEAQAREIVTTPLPLSWKIRKAFWNGFLGLKYKGAKPTPSTRPRLKPQAAGIGVSGLPGSQLGCVMRVSQLTTI